MTKYEQAILLTLLHSAAEDYIKQRQLLKEYMATNPKFPMLSQKYHECKSELLTLVKICRKLGVKGADMAIQMLEDEE